MLYHTPLKEGSTKSARQRCIRKFLFYFPKGFQGEKFIQWERQYKLDAHKQFHKLYNKSAYRKLLRDKKYEKIASDIVKIESRTNLLFSFEKMALRDAVKFYEGAKAFSIGLYDYVFGENKLEHRFEKFVDIIAMLPRKQTRVLTWPLVTVFGFLANPLEHIFLKPRVTQSAALKYKFDFDYKSKPNWNTYLSLLQFAETVKADIQGYSPKDYIDIQSFIWVVGSEEYPD